MANGRLGKTLAGNGSVAQLYQAPGTIAYATVNVIVCNTSGADRLFRVAISTSLAVGAADWLDFDLALAPGQSRELTALVVSPGEYILVQANGTGVSCRAHGHEKL